MFYTSEDYIVPITFSQTHPIYPPLLPVIEGEVKGGLPLSNIREGTKG